MKKRLFLLFLVLVMMLTACGAAEEPDPVYTIEKDGMTFTVNTTDRTIAHDGTVYSYTAATDTNGTTYTIRYPDGAEYYMVCEENLRYGGWSDSYDAGRHLDGEILIEVLWENRPVERQTFKLSDHFIIGLGLIIIGIIDVVYPYGSWYSAHGWHYQDAEPSQVSLNLFQALGILGIIGGVILLFV